MSVRTEGLSLERKAPTNVGSDTLRQEECVCSCICFAFFFTFFLRVAFLCCFRFLSHFMPRFVSCCFVAFSFVVMRSTAQMSVVLPVVIFV